jgi:hypothetical protein
MSDIRGLINATIFDDKKRNTKTGILLKIDGISSYTIDSTIINLTNTPISLSYTAILDTYYISNNKLMINNMIANNGYYYINISSTTGLLSNWKSGNVIYKILNGVASMPDINKYYLDITNKKIYKTTDGNGTAVKQNNTNSNYIYKNKTTNLYTIYCIGSDDTANILNKSNPVLLDDNNIYYSNGVTTELELRHAFDQLTGNYYINNKIVDKVKVGDEINILDAETDTYSKYLCTSMVPVISYKYFVYGNMPS